MSYILFAWELGAQLGHITRLKKTAECMLSRGHQGAMALRELHNLGNMDLTPGLPVFQAPIWTAAVGGLPDPPLNFSEMLLRFGYHDPRYLSGFVDAWINLYSQLRPDAIVADHAPTALLAARILGIPAIPIGSGFFIPPRKSPTPCMRPWLTVSEERLKSSDQLVLSTINALLEKHKRAPLDAVHALYTESPQILTTYRELDHYADRENDAVYLGCDPATDSGRPAEWPATGKKRIFAYLDASLPDFPDIMLAITRSGNAGMVYARGISKSATERFESEGLKIFDTPLRLSSLLQDCDLAITHASLATVSACLLRGIPLLLLPNHLEQTLIALRCKEMGAGVVVNNDRKQVDYEQLITSCLLDPNLKVAAQRFSVRYADLDASIQQVKIAQTIEQAIAA